MAAIEKRQEYYIYIISPPIKFGVIYVKYQL